MLLNQKERHTKMRKLFEKFLGAEWNRYLFYQTKNDRSVPKKKNCEPN